jgi:hypothetical protein
MPEAGRPMSSETGRDRGEAMSDPDSAQRRRPPTIDLTAQEVEAERPAEAKESAAASIASAESAAQGGASTHDAGRSARRIAPYVFAGLIGAAGAVAVIAGLWLAGVVPPRGAAAPQSATATSAAPAPRSAELTAIAARLEKIEGALQAKPTDAGLATRITGLETQTKALGDSVAALTRRVDEVAQSTHDLTAEAKAAAAAAQDAKAAAQSKVQSGDLDQITQRVTALENAVKTLSAEAERVQPSADDRAARAAVAASALAAAVERGAPFRAELASVTALGADEHAIAALTPFADEGLPSAAALSRDLTKLLPALRQASATQSKDGSLMARLEMNAQKLVRITRTDAAPTGDDPASIVTRIDMDARSGDLAAALADIARLPPQTRALADDWTKKAEAREAAVAASRRLAAETVAALGKPTQQ